MADNGEPLPPDWGEAHQRIFGEPQNLKPSNSGELQPQADAVELDTLYNPSISDLELDEHRGEDRPVIYLDQAKKLVTALLHTEREGAEVKTIQRISTDGRPLNAPPLIVKQPVPCPRCGAEEYADWWLYPHQVYNAIMPGGTGHYCLPCFCAVVVEQGSHSRLTNTEKEPPDERTTQ